MYPDVSQASAPSLAGGAARPAPPQFETYFMNLRDFTDPDSDVPSTRDRPEGFRRVSQALAQRAHPHAPRWLDTPARPPLIL